MFTSIVNRPRHRAGQVVAISVSEQKGCKKRNVPEARLRREFGIVGDAHAGSGPRQVSLLALDSIAKMRAAGAEVAPGDFAENFTTAVFDLLACCIGDRLRIGRRVLLEVTQIGKICHNRCAIFYQVGDCVMPKEGIFAKVLRGGTIRVGDAIHYVNKTTESVCLD